MRNKTLLTLGVATALVIPFGAAVAAAQEADNPTSTTVLVADQDRDQIRDCDLYDSDTMQLQDRDRDQLRDPAVGDVSPVQERVRERAHVMLNSDAGAESPGVANGAGMQFGHGNR